MARKRQDASQGPRLFRREVRRMPEGYYSGDQPNPNLRAFVEAHLREKPYDPETDDYDVPAFDKPIETTKATAIYNMHTYWSKKPHDAIRQYIHHYTDPGDLVLDPFCGSGGTALAALMEGRKAIAIDRSPAATFITKNYCTPVDVDELQAAVEELKAKVKPEIDWLYETRCDRCGGRATTGYTVYSQVFQCPRCMANVPLFDCVETEVADAEGKAKTVNACPHCRKRGVIEEISTRGKRLGSVPVMVSYLCEAGCTPKRDQRRHSDEDRRKREYFELHDLGKLREVEERGIPHWYPTDRMMHAPEDQECWGVLWRPYLRGVDRVDQLYTHRNLWALAALRSAIGEVPDSELRSPLLFAFTSIVLINSRMCDAFNTQISKGTYYLPPIFKQIRPDQSFAGKVSLICEAEQQRALQCTELCVSTETATALPMPPNSVDYVFTDPPYSWKVQYGEANFVWEAWLGADSAWHDQEVIVNAVRGRSEAEWADMLGTAVAECYRVLKPGRWLSLCYHDTSEGTWAVVQDIIAQAGFVPDSAKRAVFIDTDQKSWKQNVADKVTKRDLVVNFRKPRPGELSPQLLLTGDEDETTFREKAHAIIRDHLSAHPGVTKDRVYDEVVSRMVRAGVMEAHDFDGLLLQVAEPARDQGAGQRWYLKDAEESCVDEAETAKEEAAAATVGHFLAERLRAEDDAEGVHYGEVFEHFIYAVRDKPRRELADWLPDYFYKTEEGTWRPPQGEDEERLKAEGRAQGVNRRIKRHLSYLEHGLAVPDGQRPTASTLAEWIRHAKRSGLYDQGRLLYEKGGLDLDALPEDTVVDVEEDYQTCKRMLARDAAAAKPKRSRKPKSDETLKLDL